MYSSHKFDAALTEIAHHVSLDGTCETAGSVDTTGHFSFVIFTLDDVHIDHDLHSDVWLEGVRQVRHIGYKLSEKIVQIIEENDQGFVRCIWLKHDEAEGRQVWASLEEEVNRLDPDNLEEIL